MKKNTFVVRFLCILLMAALLFSVTGFAVLEPTETAHFSIPTDIQRIMELQEPACLANNNLYNALPKDNFGNAIFPDDFAGSFIDEDDYKLVIQLTKITDEQILYYSKLCNDSSAIKFAEVEYSWKYLESMMQYVNLLHNKGIQILSAEIQIQENCFFIKTPTEQVDIASNILENEWKTDTFPVFISEGSPVQQYSSLCGGDRIYNTYSQQGCSLGVCGSFNGNNAFVTCGHGNGWQTTITHLTNYNATGIVESQSFSLNYNAPSYGDYSIVRITNNTKTMLVRGQNGTLYTVTNIFVPTPNAYVIKYGNSSGYGLYQMESAIALITNTVTTGSYPTIPGGTSQNAYAKYLYPAHYCSVGTVAQPGDSGGPVYYLDGSSAKVLGTVVGSPGLEPYTLYISPLYLAVTQGFSLS